jgi:hypothetical protein
VNRKLITLLLICTALCAGCTVIPKPYYIIGTTPSFDASTPVKEVNKQNSGFVGFLENGNGILTLNAVTRYNNLVKRYAETIKTETGAAIEKNSGIFPIGEDNILYEIDTQHLYYFILMNQWSKQNK